MFSLLDTKEARWLPTALTAYHDTLCITAALSFDSYTVLSHGRRHPPEPRPLPLQMKNCNDTSRGWVGSLSDGEYAKGCYFCSDVTIPHAEDIHSYTSGQHNITSKVAADVSLDRKCTATRPGLAYIASGIAVELMASIISEKERVALNGTSDSANTTSTNRNNNNNNNDNRKNTRQVMQMQVPHQIRGSCFSQNQHHLKRYDYCVACSDYVLHAMAASEFESVGLVLHEFYRSVFSIAGPHILMEVSGSKRDAAAADKSMQEVLAENDFGVHDDKTLNTAGKSNF